MIAGLSTYITPDSSWLPGVQSPRFGSSRAKKPAPARSAGSEEVWTQLRGVYSGKTPWLVRVQAAVLPSRVSENTRFAGPTTHTLAGGFLASCGTKAHCVGGVRSSTAAMALATCAQSVAVMNGAAARPR